MARRDDEFDKSSDQEEISSSRQLVQCAECSRTVGYSTKHPYCPMCGAKLEFSTPNYSGRSDDIVTDRDRFPVHRRASIVERRRCNRVPCRVVRACINTGGATSVIGDMPNVSRNGMCLRTFEQLRPEALVSIATYYTEGSINIFQNGRVVWMRYIESGVSEYGIEFASARYS
jgi:hypothetical protein